MDSNKGRRHSLPEQEGDQSKRIRGLPIAAVLRQVRGADWPEQRTGWGNLGRVGRSERGASAERVRGSLGLPGRMAVFARPAHSACT